MKDSCRIDLHMHSTVSDGTDTPEQLLDHVREAGIEVFALTDHDAVMGCDVIRRVRRADDPRFLNGVEFSCRDEQGKYHKRHSIDIRVVHKDDDIILRIRDDCVPFNPRERKALTDSHDILKNAGIRIVYQIAKSVEYQNLLGLNVLTIRI